jgi:hypothetical protein
MTMPRSEGDSAWGAAWEVIRSSDFATALDALQEAPADVEDVAMRLAEMRARVPRLAHDIDKQAREELALVHGQLVREREAAQTYQGIAKDMRAETELRDKIAKKHPTLHAEETTARHSLRREQKTGSGKKAVLYEGQGWPPRRAPSRRSTVGRAERPTGANGCSPVLPHPV